MSTTQDGKESSPSSLLSMVNSSKTAHGSSVTTAKTKPAGDDFNQTATTAPTSSSSPSSASPTSSLPILPARLDFIGPSQAVKDLFALPYATEREVSVALHNMNGTLLIDADPRITLTGASFMWQQQQQQQQRPHSRRRRPRPDHTQHINNNSNHASAPAPPTPSSFMLLPQNEEGGGGGDEEQSEAMALVASVIDQKSLLSRSIPPVDTDPNNDGNTTKTTNHNNNTLSLPRPEEYTQDLVPPLPEPREHLSWKFREYNLLVGTDALIYRNLATNPSSNSSSNNNNAESLPSPADDQDDDAAPSNALPPPTTAKTNQSSSSATASSQALTVRIEEVSNIQALFMKHQDMVRKGEFVADYHLPLLQQRGKPSYAQAVAAVTSNKTHDTLPAPDKTTTRVTAPPALPVAGSFAAPNLEQERLQTCIVPSYRSPLGGLLSPATTTSRHAHDSTIASSSPVCTVLDAYLDNIMANVPQLALCLRERGFIQSVKLLQTHDIPSGLLHPSTLDLSRPFANVVVPKDKNNPDDDGALFSPQIMEMNAATLLRFLKANCTRDNVTYLLRRPINQTNIELYDISSISTQRHRQWIWWLATMSYRFALRLGHLTRDATASSSSTSNTWQARQAQLRSFRIRQRSLFQNALDLLEELRDMDGGTHETLVAAICEHLADSYLNTSSSSGSNQSESSSTSSATMFPSRTNSTPASTTTASEVKVESPPTCKERDQPYASVTVDALNKAQDYLLRAIQLLKPLLHKMLSTTIPDHTGQERRPSDAGSSNPQQQQQQLLVVSVCRDEDDEDDSSVEEENKANDDSETDANFPADTIALQLFGLHHKLINVSLRLAEHHLHNYWSSSAMQSLRTSARNLADAIAVLRWVEDVLPEDDDMKNDSSTGLAPSPQQQLLVSRQYQHSLLVQYTWLWEHCGHFARSFAGDENWRERGHASGDDVISLLQDVEGTFANRQPQENDMDWCHFFRQSAPLSCKTQGMVSLQSLTALIDPGLMSTGRSANHFHTKEGQEGIFEATELFMEQGQIARDKRRVLVAACVAYGRAIGAYQDFIEAGTKNILPAAGKGFIILLQQRLGDTCNETGKILLTQLRQLLTSCTPDIKGNHAADVLLSSAEFWFTEGLEIFTECQDLRNVALLRCNLCQCYKLRANSNFASSALSESGSHAATCLEQAVFHLEAAHEVLGVRDFDARTWDMVSEELASTFLVLGVRRRQSLLGGGTTPIVLHAFRLNPGRERSIIHPMERSLSIYQQLGNKHQAAAVHYQLALFYAKVWTCQRDETKTREKLAAAFKHFSCAHSYFYHAPPGNEPTFVLICLDLSSLYSAVSGKECLDKALSCCLDTCDAFSQETITAAIVKEAVEWFEKMETLASSVEDRVFKLLKELVRLERDTGSGSAEFKELYRIALTTKAAFKPTDNAPQGEYLLATYRLLSAVKAKHALE